MIPEGLEQLSDEELIKEAAKSKSYKIYDAIFFGFLVGVAIYSSVKNGFGLLTFLPLVYLPIAGKNKKNREALKKLLEKRNLK